MTQNRANPIVQRIGFAVLLAVFLAGCGGGGSTTTPPPPPPFRPQAITVNLGDHGGSITLMTTQAGGYTRDGQAFTSGTEVEAENGNRYRVTLTGQTWSAEFLPPDAVEVQLGTSGDTVSITQLEDRSYQVDGQPLGEDRTVTADNGNMYRLTLEDSGWMWEFLPPEAVEVQLGTSGDTVSITQLEDRSYQVDGQPLGEDRTVTADNGNMYRLTLEDSGWMWEFLPPDAVEVRLGTSGDTVTITQLEDRSYQVNGNALASGDVLEAGNGNRYRLTLDETGWSWEFLAPDPVPVALGTSGDLVFITQLEDGTYQADGQPLGEDRIVTADNGNMYRLTLDDTGWMWEFVPPEAVSLQLGTSGTTVQITQQENGKYLVDGNPLPGDRIVEAANGSTYRLTLDLAGWSWEFVPPEAVVVELGTSGDSVMITQLEDRSYEVDGEAFPADGIVSAANGNRYRLVETAGVWSWEFVAPPAVSLALGTSGTTVMITQLEDFSYEVDGNPLPADGIVPAANGNQYRLVQAAGVWSWEFVAPPAVSLALGTSGTTVMITQLENLSYEVDGKAFPADAIVEADNGNRYRLLQTAGVWSPEFVAPPAVSLDLGTSRTTVVITQLENRSFEVDGNPLPADGIVEADNGNRYRLVQTAGVWSPEYVPPPAISLPLGTSGTTVEITQLEDRSFEVDGNPFPADGIVRAANGSRYQLVLTAGVWDWVFVPPGAEAVPLGTSGTAVLITQNEDGTYLVDGQPLSEDRIVTAANGHRFRLTLGPTGWSADPTATPFQVQLGTLGGTRTVTLREDGQYWLDNEVVTSGETTVTGDNQKTYELVQGADGVWRGVYQPETFPVRIGDTDEVLDVIVRLEDDTYVFGTQEVASGDKITASDDNVYTLSLDSSTGMWTATPEVTTVTVALGTGGETVELTRLPDGTYERDGVPFESGNLVIDSDGIVGYRLTLTEDGWTATVHCVVGVTSCGVDTGPDPGPDPEPDRPTPTRSDNLETVQSLPDGQDPTFKTADEDPDPDEGTTLVIVGSSGSTTPQEYELHDLLGRGLVEDTRTYVDAARAAIQKVRADIQRKVTAGVYANGALDPHEDILGAGKSWDQLKTALDGIFGTSTQQRAAAASFLGDPPTGRRDTNLDADEVGDVLEIIDEILDSISTLAKFEADVFGNLVAADGTSLTGLSAEDVYEAGYSKLQFGSSRNTRFAAYAIQQDDGSASVAATWDVGAFAYSPLEVSTRAMIPNRGEAQFEGDTIAVQAGATPTGDTTLYSGDIELRVRFGTGRVLGLITNLRDENNNLWTYDGTAIESIRLPIGAMGTGDATFSVTGPNTSDLRFVSATPTSTFQGKFVGDDSDEADAVLGTWTIAEVSGVQGVLSGAFGAEYTRTRTSPRTPGESSPAGSRAETSLDFTLDVDGDVTLGHFEGIDPSRLYSRSTSILRSTDANQTISAAANLQTDESLRLTVNFRRTDYTRYGVWEQERTAADNTVTVEQQGVFAYSYLEPTVFSTEPDSDHVYPANISATYSGQTIAMDRAADPAIYTGSIEMTVNWNSALSAAALDSMVIRSLRSGSTYFAVDGEAVDRIVMTGAVSFTGAGDGIRFDSTPTMEVWYRDPLLTRSSLTGSHDARFVGLSIDGPVAVIGKWSVTSGANTLIDGAYGAQLQP